MQLRPQEQGFAPGVQDRRNMLKQALIEELDYPCPANITLGALIGVDYGYTTMPSGRGHRFHKGVDLNAKRNDDIVSVFEGEVEFAGLLSRDYGNTVIIRHEVERQPFWSVYAHLDSIDVVVGQQVGWSDRVGGCGDTGNAVGCHLHFEVRLLENDGACVVDPIPLLWGKGSGTDGPYFEGGAIKRLRPADF